MGQGGSGPTACAFQAHQTLVALQTDLVPPGVIPWSFQVFFAMLLMHDAVRARKGEKQAV